MSGRLAALVTGAHGQLGHDLVTVLGSQPDVLPVWGPRHADLDIGDAVAVERYVGNWASSARREGAARLVIFNAAAYTAVDAAETDEPAALRVNAAAPGFLAAVAQSHGARLVHVSSDYIFPGDATTPYPEEAPVAPLSAYGRTKAAGERAVLAAAPEQAYVVRSAWLYSAHAPSFVRTMARLEHSRDTVEVVTDQRGSPTWSYELAQGLLALVVRGAPPGIYHCVCAGEASWYELARAVFEELGADPDRVRPVSSDRFARPAPRPAYSVLGTFRWDRERLPALPHWRTALHTALARTAVST